MSNRKQPFGYRMSNGEIIVDACEAEIIKEVYCRYVSGSSFKELADIMNGRKIKYCDGKTWNHNMIGRILVDGRYIGAKDYPAIISEEDFTAAAKTRNKKVCKKTKSEVERAFSRIADGIITKQAENEIIRILNRLAENPKLIEYTSPEVSSDSIAEEERKLDEASSNYTVKNDEALELAERIASMRYDELDNMEYETYRLREFFNSLGKLESLDRNVIDNAIKAVITEPLTLILKNNQRMGV